MLNPRASLMHLNRKVNRSTGTRDAPGFYSMSYNFGETGKQLFVCLCSVLITNVYFFHQGMRLDKLLAETYWEQTTKHLHNHE